jgi:hypothetical protein
MNTDIDLSQVPLSCYQSGPVRSVIETELSLVVLDLAERGRDVSVTQEQAIHDVVVPAIFFRALEQGKVTQSVMNGIIDMTVDFLHWVRLEVRRAVLEMLGMEP